MTAVSPIDAYLDRLERELRSRRAPRRRLLAEAEDHLRSAAEELVACGHSPSDAEQEAIERFGDAPEVALRFAHARASSSARSAARWAAAAFLAYGATALVFLVSAPAWLRDFPHGALSVLAMQVAGVALALTAVRFLGRREPLRLIANGALVATVAVTAGAGGELVVALTRPAAAPWSDVAPLIGAFALAGALCVPALLVAAASRVRASGLGGRDEGDLTLADDVEAVAPTLGHVVRTVLQRPGRTCAALAGAAFVAVSVAQLVGANSSSGASPLLGAAAVGLLEATAIAIGFLTLGRPLGLRSHTRS